MTSYSNDDLFMRNFVLLHVLVGDRPIVILYLVISFISHDWAFKFLSKSRFREQVVEVALSKCETSPSVQAWTDTICLQVSTSTTSTSCRSSLRIKILEDLIRTVIEIEIFLCSEIHPTDCFFWLMLAHENIEIFQRLGGDRSALRWAAAASSPPQHQRRFGGFSPGPSTPLSLTPNPCLPSLIIFFKWIPSVFGSSFGILKLMCCVLLDQGDHEVESMKRSISVHNFGSPLVYSCHPVLLQ